MLKLIMLQTDGAEYLTTPAGKAVGAVILVVGIIAAVVIFRKVIAAKAKRLADEAKDRLK